MKMTINEALQIIENVISKDNHYLGISEEEIEFVNEYLEILAFLKSVNKKEYLDLFIKEWLEETDGHN